MRTLLSALAQAAPARCVVVAGEDAVEEARRLRLDPRLQVLQSPRSASVLVVLGRLRPDLLMGVMAAHDAMPKPRGVVARLGREGLPHDWPFAGALVVAGDAEVAPAVVRVRDELLRGERPSSPPLLADEDPAPWRGVGPYGQGGTGMTGGVPYGRPLPGRAPDRDGLQLDQIRVRIGPFFAPFPPGLQLDLLVQGDVVQAVEVPGADEDGRATGGSAGHGPAARRPVEPASVFERALVEPVPLGELELARARHLLYWSAEFVRLRGLVALSQRILGLASGLTAGSMAEVDRLVRRLERDRSLRWGTRKVGTLTGDHLGRLPGGPNARAGGDARDARSDDPAYRELGFAPITHGASDAYARWSQRLAETRQALDLARRAASLVVSPGGRVEGPRGPLGPSEPAGSPALALLPELLPGMEWGDAVTTVVSLDLASGGAGRAPHTREPRAEAG